MTFEYKVEAPYPIASKLILQNGNILNADIIYLEGRGCIIEMVSPFLKTGDKVSLEFALPSSSAFKEACVIIKLYIQFKDSKPHYMAELHFKKPSENTVRLIEEFIHEATVRKNVLSAKNIVDKPDKK